MVTRVPPAVSALADRLVGLGWVTDLLVAGSLVTGDYIPGVSDLDLVALTDGPVGDARQEVLTGQHRKLSGAARAELVRHGFAVFGRSPAAVPPDMTDDDVRRAGQLLTKTRAAEQAHAPAWLWEQLQARRRGEQVVSPRVRTALIAWRDARRTVAKARRRAPD